MFAMYANGWPSAIEDPTDERDRYHRIALHEARIASDWSAAASRRSEAAGLLDRVRRAIGIAPAQPDCAACTA